MSSIESIFSLKGDLDGTINEAELNYENLTQYIGLVIGKEEFMYPIASIAEIIMLPTITYVPGCHKYIEGVINLRGKILPVINLRRIMSLERNKPSQSNRVIIANHEDIQVGIIVDAITYVTALKEEEIEAQSIGTSSFGADLISSISKKGDEINGILDITKVLSAVEYISESDAENAEEDEQAA